MCAIGYRVFANGCYLAGVRSVSDSRPVYLFGQPESTENSHLTLESAHCIVDLGAEVEPARTPVCRFVQLPHKMTHRGYGFGSLALGVLVGFEQNEGA